MRLKSDTIVVVLMGVAGAGKTTVGKRLAAQLDWSFRDADDLHQLASIERMSGGLPLRDEDRAPWLHALARLIGSHVQTTRPLVLACSALGRAHREALLSDVEEAVLGTAVRFVHLRADPEVLAERLAQRTGHFFPPSLLASQLARLELSDDGDTKLLEVDATQPVDDVVAEIRELLRL